MITSIANAETLTMSATDLLNAFGTKLNRGYTAYTMQDFTFFRESHLSEATINWRVYETDRPDNDVQLQDAAVCRILFALSCYADVDVIAEALNLR